MTFSLRLKVKGDDTLPVRSPVSSLRCGSSSLEALSYSHCDFERFQSPFNNNKIMSNPVNQMSRAVRQSF